MLLNIKYHLSYILIVLFTILSNCQLQDPDKNHGILFLENRSGKLMVEKSNQNEFPLLKVFVLIGYWCGLGLDDSDNDPWKFVFSSYLVRKRVCCMLWLFLRNIHRPKTQNLN